MQKIVVQVENLSKRYRIGRRKEAYGTLRDTIAGLAGQSVRSLRQLTSRNRNGEKFNAAYQPFWALKGITFDVWQGEVFGIIGPNGAGKSTLLKILSRITYPTTGEILIHGRVGSLLEVGTGFHPELTGRENIYLNGAVLGMPRAEINRRFDDIVAFAEIEQFLDTPVKRFSSGQYMRLAFAVAAHLEPEILIVDEVLAVGDIEFQKKCLGKMQQVARDDGRTVLFVSHNMDAIRRLCSQVLLLEGGRISSLGKTAEVVSRYESYARNMPGAIPDTWIDLSRARREGTGEVRFISIRYTSGDTSPDIAGQPYSNGPLEFLCELESDANRPLRSLAVSIEDLHGSRLVNADSVLIDRVITLDQGRNQVRLSIDRLYLNPGTYRVALWMADPARSRWENTAYDYIESAFEIQVVRPALRENGLEDNSSVTCDFDLMRAQ